MLQLIAWLYYSEFLTLCRAPVLQARRKIVPLPEDLFIDIVKTRAGKGKRGTERGRKYFASSVMELGVKYIYKWSHVSVPWPLGRASLVERTLKNDAKWESFEILSFIFFVL